MNQFSNKVGVPLPAPGRGRIGSDGSWWEPLEETSGGRRAVPFDRPIGSGDDNGRRHVRIVLEPLDSDFEPIELTAEDEDSIAVVAELVEVLGVDPPTPASSPA